MHKLKTRDNNPTWSKYIITYIGRMGHNNENGEAIDLFCMRKKEGDRSSGSIDRNQRGFSAKEII